MRDMGVRVVLGGATERLSAAGVPSPRADAELLLTHVLDLERSKLPLVQELSANQLDEYERLLSRRCAREPLQHLTGEAYFRHLTLAVGPGVFVPRPETETLVDLALAELADLKGRDGGRKPVVVDLCTGSAAIPLAIATEAGGVHAIGVELSADACRWATTNLAAYADQLDEVGSGVDLVSGDACQAASLLSELVARVDVLTCNPPYIPAGAIPRDPEVRDFDPAVALYGGPDGLDIARHVVGQAARLLRPGGLLLLEHGDEQGESGGTAGFPELVRRAGGFTDVSDEVDLAGRPRITLARRSV